LLRFLKKSKFDIHNATALLLSHINWRLQNDLANLSLDTLFPSSMIYYDQRFLSFLPNTLDVYGRPIAIMNLKDVWLGGNDESLRWFAILALEVGRRLIFQLNEKRKRENDIRRCGQCSIILDVEGVGMSHIVSIRKSQITLMNP